MPVVDEEGAPVEGVATVGVVVKAVNSVTNGGVVSTTLAAYRFGAGDPTTRLDGGEFWRASHTPDGPATLRIGWRTGRIEAEAWGTGRNWMLAQVTAMTGQLDQGHHFEDGHPALLRAQRNHPETRFGASSALYHELLPTILGQRITAGEAIRQWHRLCRELGDAAPGPAGGLLLPPSPTALVGHPAWWFHRLGVEAKRAEALRTVAKHASKLWDWAALPSEAAAAKLALLPGVGQWTIGSVLGSALGDPDALAVGDFHLKNIVSFTLADEPRGTDERMLALLAPYAGQRGRVVRLLLLDGAKAPAFGPRQRILPMAQW